MKPRPREAPRISCSRGYSYDCCKQRRGIINVRKRGYFLPSALSSLSPSGISSSAKLGNGHHSTHGTATDNPGIRFEITYFANSEKEEDKINHIYFTISKTMILQALMMGKLNAAYIYEIKIASILLLNSTLKFDIKTYFS